MNRPDYVTCILRGDKSTKTWCGRTDLLVEFSFLGVTHALANSQKQGRLLSCPACVAACTSELQQGAWEARPVPNPMGFYAWFRPTNEYLTYEGGWTLQLDEAADCDSRAEAHDRLQEACKEHGRDYEQGCVSLGIDLIGTGQDEARFTAPQTSSFTLDQAIDYLCGNLSLLPRASLMTDKSMQIENGKLDVKFTSPVLANEEQKKGQADAPEADSQPT